jgi:hypothetical protein
MPASTDTYTSEQAKLFGGCDAANVVEKHSELCQVDTVRYSTEHNQTFTAKKFIQETCSKREWLHVILLRL